MTPSEYDKKLDGLSLQVVQLVLAHCSNVFGSELKDFKQCQAIIESELKNPILSALDHYLNGTD